MSRSRHERGRPRGYPVCRGCPRCSWFPKRLQDSGKRTDRVLRVEEADELAVTLTGDDPSWWDDAAEDAELVG
jgi:hypothetical protein